MAKPIKVTDRNKRHKRKSRSREQSFGKRVLREYFLIVTNGKETEQQYFNRIIQKMPPNTVKHIEIDFQNLDPRGLAKYAREEAKKLYRYIETDLHIAAVFDKDDFAHFNNAVSSLKASKKRPRKLA